MRVITHKSPDMDALVASYIYLKEKGIPLQNLEFKSVFEIPKQEPGVIYIDISPEEVTDEDAVFDHHDTPDTDICAATVVHDELGQKLEYESLVTEALLQDHVHDAKIKKQHDKLPPLMFRTILMAYKKQYADDQRLAVEMFKLFDIVVEYERDLTRAINEIHYAQKEGVLEFIEDEDSGLTIALVKEFLAPPTRNHIFTDPEIAADFIIYKVKNNAGITRNADTDWPDLQDLEEYIDEEGWFFHKGGFLAARGSEKHPALSESKYSVEELCDMLVELARSQTENEVDDEDTIGGGKTNDED